MQEKSLLPSFRTPHGVAALAGPRAAESRRDEGGAGGHDDRIDDESEDGVC